MRRIGTLASLAVLALCAACGGSSGGTKAATTPSVTPSVSASTPSAPPAVQSSAPVAPPTSAPPAPPSMASRVSAWYHGGGGHLMNTIEHDITLEGRAGQDEDEPGLARACGKLRTDVERMQGIRPVPAKSVRRPMAAAMIEYARSAGNCISGIQDQDGSLIQEASSQIDAATADIKRATKAIGALP